MASEDRVLATAQVILMMMLALMAAIAAVSLLDFGIAPEEYHFGTPVSGWQRASPALYVVTNAVSIVALVGGSLLLRSRIARKPRTFVLCALAFLSLFAFN